MFVYIYVCGYACVNSICISYMHISDLDTIFALIRHLKFWCLLVCINSHRSATNKTKSNLKQETGGERSFTTL